MVEKDQLIKSAKSYGINGVKLISNNANVLKYGDLNEIEDILSFLVGLGAKTKNIEKCPSVLFYGTSEKTKGSTLENIKDVYKYLMDDTILSFDDIEDVLSILVADLNEVKRIYSFVSKKYGAFVIKKCPSILNGNYDELVLLTATLEDTIGLDIVKDNGGSLLVNTTKVEFLKILFIPEFQYNADDKSYNKSLLTASTFVRTYDEIKDILKLKYWDKEKYPAFQKLLTANIWHRTDLQIEDILKLKYWDKEEYPEFQALLTSTIWQKTAEQIIDVLEMKWWDKEKYPAFQKLLMPIIWNKDVTQIEAILKLKYWDEKKYPAFQKLLTANIWRKTDTQIGDILELEYWDEENYPAFQALLTPSIWQKTAEQIVDVLEMKWWKEEKYQTLLTSSIWNKTAKQIDTNIQICLENDLEEFSNNPTLILRLTSNELLAKINYLNYWRMPLYNEKGKIHPLFGMSNKNMKARYGISKKELVRDYLCIDKGKKYVL